MSCFGGLHPDRTADAKRGVRRSAAGSAPDGVAVIGAVDVWGKKRDELERSIFSRLAFSPSFSLLEERDSDVEKQETGERANESRTVSRIISRIPGRFY